MAGEVFFFSIPEKSVIKNFFNTSHTIFFKTHLKEQYLNSNITFHGKCLLVRHISTPASETEVLNKDQEGNINE